ncbi:hypothetical protein KP509_37G050100 [Ceratopteris richardii]|uniref:Phosphatidic acid phosphatase type 2/haloperoxidase domain-containing protein n=1 Tax=Ceratopteris richardii TaxID=49495 RepID=A0A8T2Q7M1_CERRI|nr:hypothetical protein KP509_37G050100 [Ceratopteris richardii]
MQGRSLDVLFAILAVLVSKEFYTFFLPLLFWSGHSRLARQMTLLMAFSTYIGNCVKDTFSAPRPPSPPVRRFTVTDSEKVFASEYGLPSSHAMNTVGLLGYLLLYSISHFDITGFHLVLLISLFVMIAVLTIIGRLYLGMHSPIDTYAGVFIGLGLLTLWSYIGEFLDSFIVSGSNVESFWVSLSILLQFAYPMPETPTPSFEYNTAFTGVALGVVLGVNRTYHQYHHVVLFAKVASKELAKVLLPSFSNLLNIPVKSSTYIPAMHQDMPSVDDEKSGQVQDVLDCKRAVAFFGTPVPYDIDTGIRFCTYTSLGWSVVELVPYLFDYLGL